MRLLAYCRFFLIAMNMFFSQCFTPSPPALVGEPESPLPSASVGGQGNFNGGPKGGCYRDAPPPQGHMIINYEADEKVCSCC